jgi:hypothetical protein
MIEASVSFAGNLTDEIEVRSTESGIARALFRWPSPAGGSKSRRSSPWSSGGTRPSMPRSPWPRQPGGSRGSAPAAELDC